MTQPAAPEGWDAASGALVARRRTTARSLREPPIQRGEQCSFRGQPGRDLQRNPTADRGCV